MQEYFNLFQSVKEGGTETGSKDNNDLAKFLQEWQRKMIVWGGDNVLKAFIDWKIFMEINELCAESFYLMDGLFKEMRKDIELSNRKLEKGFFMHVIMKNSVLFLEMAKKNPKITMAELVEIEKELVK